MKEHLSYFFFFSHLFTFNLYVSEWFAVYKLYTCTVGAKEIFTPYKSREHISNVEQGRQSGGSQPPTKFWKGGLTPPDF